MKFIIAFDFQDNEGNSLVNNHPLNGLKIEIPENKIIKENYAYLTISHLERLLEKVTFDKFISHLFYRIPGTVEAGLIDKDAPLSEERPFQYSFAHIEFLKSHNNRGVTIQHQCQDESDVQD